MGLIQEIIDIDKVDLLNKVSDMKKDGHRLAQICVTNTNQNNFILLYSFIKDECLVSFKIASEISESIESIGWLYSYAFLYENEMKDLFGINILNMNLDFKGHLYETMVKTPYFPNKKSKNNESGEKNDG